MISIPVSAPGLREFVPVKTFDELFAELTAKAAAGTPGSGTVAALEKGVHFIGKKVVEEAAEAGWPPSTRAPSAPPRSSRSCCTRCSADAGDRAVAGGRVPTSVAGRPRPSAVPVREEPSPCSESPCPTRDAVRPRRPDAAGGRLPAALRPKDLPCRDAANDVEFFYLRPRDIATYVGSGDLDLGITGRDLLHRRRRGASRSCSTWASARATFRFAAVPGRSTVRPADLAGARIATAYPGVVQRYLAERGVNAEVIRLDGAVENAIRLGVADVDRRRGRDRRDPAPGRPGDLRRADPQVVVGAGRAAAGRAELRPGAKQLLRRLQGVLVARRYVMLAYDVRADALDAAVRADPRHRVADDLAAAPRGLGGGPGDGAARRGAPDHGRAVRGRRPRDPGDRHPRLPPVGRRRRQVADVPGEQRVADRSTGAVTVLARPRRGQDHAPGVLAAVVVVVFTLIAFGLHGRPVTARATSSAATRPR